MTIKYRWTVSTLLIPWNLPPPKPVTRQHLPRASFKLFATKTIENNSTIRFQRFALELHSLTTRPKVFFHIFFNSLLLWKVFFYLFLEHFGGLPDAPRCECVNYSAHVLFTQQSSSCKKLHGSFRPRSLHRTTPNPQPQQRVREREREKRARYEPSRYARGDNIGLCLICDVETVFIEKNSTRYDFYRSQNSFDYVWRSIRLVKFVTKVWHP